MSTTNKAIHSTITIHMMCGCGYVFICFFVFVRFFIFTGILKIIHTNMRIYVIFLMRKTAFFECIMQEFGLRVIATLQSSSDNV